MNKLIEDPEILTIGKKSFDVSNISMKRKTIARRAYNHFAQNMGTDNIKNNKLMQNILDKYGMYMIRQDLSILKRRMTLKEALKTYIERFLLTKRYIYKFSEKEYELFNEWSYFNITQRKKKESETINQILEMEKMALQEVRKIAKDPSQQRKLLQTFLQETDGRMNKLQALQKIVLSSCGIDINTKTGLTEVEILLKASKKQTMNDKKP
jgi:hypothetical protein